MITVSADLSHAFQFAFSNHCRCLLLCSGVSPSTALVRKLIAVLESIEKLPVYNYDSPGAGYGLQVGFISAQLQSCAHFMCAFFINFIFLCFFELLLSAFGK